MSEFTRSVLVLRLNLKWIGRGVHCVNPIDRLIARFDNFKLVYTPANPFSSQSQDWKVLTETMLYIYVVSIAI